jgi:CRISPR/Cas system-associated exonuclease Cas4 (RecB family)
LNNLSKSKLLAYRQCPKRLWLEIHRRDLMDLAASSQSAMLQGHEVGEIARKIYDPEGRGHFLDLEKLGFRALFKHSEALVEEADTPLFETGFSANGALALADILLPVSEGKDRAWRMVEVKSSTSIKDYHRDDAAIQAYVARSAGLPLQSIAVAHIDNTWIYRGNGDYRGLLVESDLTSEAFARGVEVESWIEGAQEIAASMSEPPTSIGEQCNKPHACAFQSFCWRSMATAEYPVSWLPNIKSKALKACVAFDASDMRDVPDHLLNAQQLRVKQCTVNQEVFFDADGAANDLATYCLPGYFLDFETSMFAIPIWAGTRPYQHIPFQFSLHILSEAGDLQHQAFLDIGGNDPSRRFAEALVAACGVEGPVFVYSARFEKGRIKELTERFPDLSFRLHAISDRMVDLLDIAIERYYHPSQQGSWSIKKVLPAIAPDLDYGELDGVQNGEMAMTAFKEAIALSCSPERKVEIEAQLQRYCELDTLAMVRIWEFLRGS